jgi:tryptophan halogenase
MNSGFADIALDMQKHPLDSVAILGGGTAGWMAAALLAKALGPLVSIVLVESEDIGTVGVGEATIPQIRHINAFLGLDENAVMRAAQATFKLGIQFNDWLRLGHSYMHSFSDIGLPYGLLPFQQYWLRAHAMGQAQDLWAYSINAQAAAQNRFARMERVGSSPLAGVRYAYHFDAGLYARHLRGVAEALGVVRHEGKVARVELRTEDGFIEALALESGARIEAGLFIDCSGFRALLIEDALQAGYDDWRHWLPCDRALAVASARVAPLRPYTQANARAAGWQWRIPLQQRSGNGHVYCSEFISDDEAVSVLLANIEGPALGEPRALRFTTGMRKHVWLRNCVALGLAAGFMEPLESTSIHLIQSGISRLLSLWPDRSFDPALGTEYNRQTRFEYERIRDFLVLHYRTTQRDDTPFWRHCAQIDMPEGLARKLALFRANGQIVRESDELFTEVGWLQVMTGQGIVPQRYNALADGMEAARLDEFLGGMRALIQRALAGMPTHAQYVAEQCQAAVPGATH